MRICTHFESLKSQSNFTHDFRLKGSAVTLYKLCAVLARMCSISEDVLYQRGTLFSISEDVQYQRGTLLV